jgi:hypothetical protein
MYAARETVHPSARAEQLMQHCYTALPSAYNKAAKAKAYQQIRNSAAAVNNSSNWCIV